MPEPYYTDEQAREEQNTVASLFDGIGGFCLAFQRAGADIVATVEIDAAAAAVSRRCQPPPLPDRHPIRRRDQGECG